MHAKYLRLIENQEVNRIPFPEGSRLIDLGNNKSRILLPNDYHYVIKSRASGAVSDITTTDVTCECTKGSGCASLKYAGKVYCRMGDSCDAAFKS